MCSHKIPEGRLWASIFSTMTAPLVAAASGTAWPITLLCGIVGTLLSLGIRRITAATEINGKVFWVIQWLWAVFLLPRILKMCGQSWQTEQGSGELIPLTLLLLAVCASLKGPDRSARIGSVLFWILWILYLVLLAAGMPGIRPGRLKTVMTTVRPGMLLTFLLPAGAQLLPRTGRQKVAWALLPILFGVAVSVCTFGTLSAGIAETTSLGFYEAVRSMRLFGVAERFEAFLSVGLTLGWFSQLSLMLGIAGVAADKVRSGCGNWGIWLAAGTCALLLALDIPLETIWLDVLGIVIWCLIPAIAAAFCRKKIFNKK